MRTFVKFCDAFKGLALKKAPSKKEHSPWLCSLVLTV